MWNSTTSNAQRPRRASSASNRTEVESVCPGMTHPFHASFAFQTIEQDRGHIDLSGPTVTFINGQGTLPPQPSSWNNELHPEKAGFEKFADLFQTKLKYSSQIGWRSRIARMRCGVALTTSYVICAAVFPQLPPCRTRRP